MKIAVDCRMIDHPGIGRYIRNLLNFMILQERPESFSLYGDPAKLPDFKAAKVIDYPVQVYSFKEFFSYAFNSDAELLHVPHFNAPRKKKTKLVVTVHDLMYLRLRESAPYLKRLGARVVILNALKNADRLIAVSDNTKKDILNLYPAAESKVRVIYEAADPMFKKISDKEQLEGAREKLGLPKDFILFVGSLKRHKNIIRLIKACNGLKSRGLKYELVVVGRFRPDEPEIIKAIQESQVRYLSEVSGQDLLYIYNLASLLVLPSLYEGFGLPVLEAMACGVPVIASKATSLPEIAGDAGVLCEPLDVADICEKMRLVLTDNRLREALIEKGLKRSLQFSWGRTAKETLDTYKEAVS